MRELHAASFLTFDFAIFSHSLPPLPLLLLINNTQPYPSPIQTHRNQIPLLLLLSPQHSPLYYICPRQLSQVLAITVLQDLCVLLADFIVLCELVLARLLSQEFLCT
jgi:hypothetical protein